MNFLIQTINGQIKHDFSFTLIESCEYQNWLRNEKQFICNFTDEKIMPDCIPIGSVEFVCNYLQKYYNLIPKPKNIPVELLKLNHTGRIVINSTEKDINGKKFVKSNDKIKSFTEICISAPQGNYQISDIVDFESEWRVFVYKGKMVGLQNYSGDFTLFPDVYKINEMITDYEHQPIAYTLDVGILYKSVHVTVVIEVHDFFSCGLYGFSDHKILPFMFKDWFNSFIDKL